jgi:hypothetical protein
MFLAALWSRSCVVPHALQVQARTRVHIFAHVGDASIRYPYAWMSLVATFRQHGCAESFAAQCVRECVNLRAGVDLCVPLCAAHSSHLLGRSASFRSHRWRSCASSGESTGICASRRAAAVHNRDAMTSAQSSRSVSSSLIVPCRPRRTAEAPQSLWHWQRPPGVATHAIGYSAQPVTRIHRILVALADQPSAGTSGQAACHGNPSCHGRYDEPRAARTLPGLFAR